VALLAFLLSGFDWSARQTYSTALRLVSSSTVVKHCVVAMLLWPARIESLNTEIPWLS
jgi:hypothetical protein